MDEDIFEKAETYVVRRGCHLAGRLHDPSASNIRFR
jgi:hypothetical protein